MSPAHPTAVPGGPWIQTYTGRAFDLAEPRAADVCLEDIAHALSHQCRFSGHTSRFYSVAEHSCRVAWDLLAEHPGNYRLALEGLLHDAAEAYLVDLPTPLKNMIGLGDAYRATERRVEKVIARHFDLPFPRDPQVGAADLRLLGREACALMAPLREGWLDFPRPSRETFNQDTGVDRCVAGPLGWEPKDARRCFVELYESYRYHAGNQITLPLGEK